MNSKKIGLSIVYKLNMQLLLRLITIFLAIDIFLCMAAGATVVVQSEKIFNGAVKELNKSGLPENTDTWLDITGYRVSVLDREPDGIKVPGFMNNFMSTSTKSIPRFFQIKTGKNGSFFQRIDGLIYSYEFTVNNQSFVFTVLLGPKIKIFRHILLGLL
ncbi:MAG: hypothetical protein PHY90_10505, partial [Desulfitobacteriaceae bacterium]|nr:hypothetical protein [Desulfitobacteriaceae bacterium]